MDNSETAPQLAAPPLTPAPRYKGVRMRKWGKWVAEVRYPNSRRRLWLGSYPTPEMAARAFDAAVYCLRGPAAALNFPDSLPEIPGASRNLSRYEIREAAARHARGGRPRDGELEGGGWPDIGEEGGGGEVAMGGGGEGSSAAVGAQQQQQQPAAELFPQQCAFIAGGDSDDDDDGRYRLSPLWNFSD